MFARWICGAGFADGDFSYYLQYNEASNGKISEDHPIIIPDEDIDAEYGPQPHDNYQGTGGVVDGPISGIGAVNRTELRIYI